jgi:hypothetical protein
VGACGVVKGGRIDRDTMAAKLAARPWRRSIMAMHFPFPYLIPFPIARALARLSFVSAAALWAGVLPCDALAASPTDNPLLAERWKTRPVVVVVADRNDALLRRLERTLQQTAVREAFIEREMVLYTVAAGEGRRNDKPLDSRRTRALLEALKLDAKGPPTFVLVGKDGETKMVEGADVDLNAVFAEIDRMPMRQR